MKLHPQNQEQIRAFLDGSRTQVSVLVEPQPKLCGLLNSLRPLYRWDDGAGDGFAGVTEEQLCSDKGLLHKSRLPLGNPGDIVCFTEEWRIWSWTGPERHEPEVVQYRDESTRGIDMNLADASRDYDNWLEQMAWESCADFEKAGFKYDDGIEEWDFDWDHDDHPCRWRLASETPEWACRVKREIVSVSAGRLQAISEADAVSEGFVFHYPTGDANVIRFAQGRQPTLRDPSTASAAFSKQWDRDHPGHPFRGNHWVWRYEVKEIA